MAAARHPADACRLTSSARAPAGRSRRPATVPPGPDRSAARRGLPLTASYHFDEPANSAVVVLVRPETNQVVRQIPPEKILRLIADLRQMVARVFDRRA